MDQDLLANAGFSFVGTAALFLAIIGLTWAAEHIVYRAVRRIGRQDSNPLPSSSIFANIARIFIVLLGVATALKVCFNLDLTGVIAALGIGALAISLGFQDTLLNLIGGLQVSLGKLAQPGDHIEVLGQRGRVTDVTWRHTSMVDVDGNQHLIPNSLMNKNPIIRLGSSVFVQVPFVAPLRGNLDDLARKMTGHVESALGACIDPGEALVIRFIGIDGEGCQGLVSAPILWGAMGVGQAQDAIMRAIADDLRAASESRPDQE